MSKPSQNALFVAVANLERAASEHSHQTRRLRQAVDTLLTWLKSLPPAYKRDLPLGCTLYPDGSFQWTIQPGSRFGPTAISCTIVRGTEHTFEDLFLFCLLLKAGFLTQLKQRLEDDTPPSPLPREEPVDHVTRFFSLSPPPPFYFLSPL